MAAEALEQSVLEAKDKDQLLAIAKALGVKASARTKKSDIIDQILESTGTPSRASLDAASAIVDAAVNGAAASNGAAPGDDADAEAPVAAATTEPSAVAVLEALDFDEPPAEWELDVVGAGDDDPGTVPAGPDAIGDRADDATIAANDGLASTPAQDRTPRERTNPTGQQPAGQQSGGQPGGQPGGEDGESRNRRRRRRRKGGAARGPDGPQGDDAGQYDVPAAGVPEPAPIEQVEVSGYLDMRDEGYGFLRVNGYLPSKDDAYIPVKLARQYGLRRGDHVTGTSRPAGRNEKNPALLEIDTVNGGDPDAARRRPRFEDLTALFPDEKLRLEDPSDPTNMTARIIDLVSPIGKGQRGIIVSPPKAGKTTVMKTIARSIEVNNPEVKLIVLLIDERPEEVTDIRRTVRGEVISSTFDRPSDEHTHVAELTIEKAKRLVEQGEDVVVILDGITRLSRAYNLAAPASGRILSGGIDAGALYPPKKFFGAARNIEEGGSLTILATALVDTNSRMD
ncbi:MAG: transcription termination factor Rho, partial [Ilumatobacteraceae bacterium]